MNLKPILLTSALALAFASLALAPTAQAVDSPTGTITFQGLVVSNSCVITVSGGTASAPGGGASGNVILPTVYTSAFSGVGTTAGTTPFTIALTGCDTNLTSTRTFWSGANINSAGGYLDNTASGGSNVAVQLLNDSGTTMDLSQATAAAQNSQSVNFSGQAALLNYSARYYATNATTSAGPVNTAVQFTMVYQ